MRFKTIALAGIILSILSGCQSTKINLGDYKEEKTKETLTIDNVNVPTDFYLVGKSWKLKTIDKKPVMENIIVTLKFQKSFNKKYPIMLSGKSACNSYTTDININDKTKKLEVSTPITHTKKICFEENIMSMEKKFLKSLQKNKKIHRKNTKELILTNKNNEEYLFGLM